MIQEDEDLTLVKQELADLKDELSQARKDKNALEEQLKEALEMVCTARSLIFSAKKFCWVTQLQKACFCLPTGLQNICYSITLE